MESDDESDENMECNQKSDSLKPAAVVAVINTHVYS